MQNELLNTSAQDALKLASDSPVYELAENYHANNVMLREQLMEVVRSHLDEPLVQRVMITDWLELPVTAIDVSLGSNGDSE